MNLKSTQAEIIVEQYQGDDLHYLMEALDRVCKHVADDPLEGKTGSTTWTMEDNSEVCIMGEDVHVTAAP